MTDLKLQVPATDTVQVDGETLAAIDRGIKDADEGLTVSIEEVRQAIPQWISRFESHVGQVFKLRADFQSAPCAGYKPACRI